MKAVSAPDLVRTVSFFPCDTYPIDFNRNTLLLHLWICRMCLKCNEFAQSWHLHSEEPFQNVN